MVFFPFWDPALSSTRERKTEFFYRLLKNGRTIVFLPESVVYHNPERSAHENRLKERESQYALGSMYAHHILRANLYTAYLLPVRLAAVLLLSFFMYLRRLFVPGAGIYFPCRPDCYYNFVLGFVRYFRDAPIQDQC